VNPYQHSDFAGEVYQVLCQDAVVTSVNQDELGVLAIKIADSLKAKGFNRPAAQAYHPGFADKRLEDALVKIWEAQRLVVSIGGQGWSRCVERAIYEAAKLLPKERLKLG
jgi:hypothetical protein